MQTLELFILLLQQTFELSFAFVQLDLLSSMPMMQAQKRKQETTKDILILFPSFTAFVRCGS